MYEKVMRGKPRAKTSTEISETSIIPKAAIGITRTPACAFRVRVRVRVRVGVSSGRVRRASQAVPVSSRP
tara:strand:+ start:546 stop:755 length:210 start_codon:yes stop_codon:yes gene_type:complete